MDDDHRDVYEALVKLQSAGEPAALATVVEASGSVPRHAGSKMLVRADRSIVGTVGGGEVENRVIAEAVAAISDGRTRLHSYNFNDPAGGDAGVCGGTIQVFIEPVGIAPVLLVIGTGHVGKAVAELGKWLGLRVIVSDDREGFCTPEYIPDMDGYAACTPDEIAQHVPINSQTYIAALTRGLPVDSQLIPTLLKTDAPYIGLIGSRRRWALTVKALKEEAGLTEAQLSRVHAPIGLELQAETPKEIAISILAEIIMLRRGGTGEPMRWLGSVSEAEVIQ